MDIRSNVYRWMMGGGAALALLLLFIFQQVKFVTLENSTTEFIINRSIRFVLNDGFAMLLLFALFHEKKYLWFAFAVQLFGLLFLLIPYFVLKFQWPQYNGPMINYWHRIIINPTLTLLLIPAFYYQKYFHQR